MLSNLIQQIAETLINNTQIQIQNFFTKDMLNFLKILFLGNFCYQQNSGIF